jgi:HEPN domain-containing protein/predicted nucleotidyltransferase
MKTSLDHLPEHKREQITAVAALLSANAPVGKLILFGSYARGDWVEDLESHYISDYDFIAIVATKAEADDKALWGRLYEQARALTGRIPVTLLVHDIKHVNAEIRVGQYFFGDIVNEGVLLHDTGRFMLARPKALNAGERLKLAEQYFGYWFRSASEFWRGAGDYAARGLGPHAAFLLHQAAERYFHAALLVFTGYKPKTHNLVDLSVMTAPLHPALEGALPRVLPADEHLFDLLKRAYIEARYSMKYRVTAEELVGIRERVLDLGRRVRVACAEKLATFCGAEAVGALPVEPSGAVTTEVPEAPPLDDAEALERWRDALLERSFERGVMLKHEGREEGRQEGLREGEAKGLQEGRAADILMVLTTRGILVPAEVEQQIASCSDPALLSLWLKRAVTASSADEVVAPTQEAHASHSR